LPNKVNKGTREGEEGGKGEKRREERREETREEGGEGRKEKGEGEGTSSIISKEARVTAKCTCLNLFRLWKKSKFGK
jgi:hypothetical protein